MDVVEQLFLCTKRLYEHLSQGLPLKGREAYIKQIEQMLGEREQLINRLPQDYAEQELIIGENTLRYDGEIHEMLTAMCEEIREDIGRSQRQKLGTRQYVQPYRNGNADGMFLDKKK